jgi:hypothetical protein
VSRIICFCLGEWSTISLMSAKSTLVIVPSPLENLDGRLAEWLCASRCRSGLESRAHQWSRPPVIAVEEALKLSIIEKKSVDMQSLLKSRIMQHQPIPED